jgi:four helix bundle protein
VSNGAQGQGQGSWVRGQGYQQLIAWQKAHQLALAVFRATNPLSQTQGWLVRQCSRSAVSVPANIAEGYSRGSIKEYIQFLQIARGSLAETEYYLVFMRDAALLADSTLDGLDKLRVETARPLLGLIRSLQSGNDRPRRVGEDPIDYITTNDTVALTPDP